MSDCLFCKIVEGEIPSEKVYEDEELFAFRDINPQAPVHLLVVPKKHVASLDEADDGDAALMGDIMMRIRHLAREQGVQSGYRVVNNCGSSAGQSVFHIHFHLLGGRDLGWPPG
jgi:histidine triad (HIT) family protein